MASLNHGHRLCRRELLAYMGARSSDFAVLVLIRAIYVKTSLWLPSRPGDSRNDCLCAIRGTLALSWPDRTVAQLGPLSQSPWFSTSTTREGPSLVRTGHARRRRRRIPMRVG